MGSWSEGYVTEVDYIHTCFPETLPAYLRWALAAAGVAPGPVASDRLRYCELGFGMGTNLVLGAAANPHAEFHGTDFNARQTHGAQRLATAGGVGNLTLADDSFDAYGGRSLPKFDVIVLHGIFSWVTPDNRAVIRRFIRERLATGGVVYNSYNSFPGWAPLMPLRNIIRSQAGDTVLDRVRNGLAEAEALKASGAAYFRANPAAGRELEKLQKQDHQYVAHEYLNDAWTPFLFSDLESEMRDARLEFTSAARVADQLDLLAVPANLLPKLREVKNTTRRENLRDILVNTRFRRDLFVRGPVRMPSAEARETLESLHFAMSTPRKRVPTTAKLSIGEITMRPEIYGPLLDALEAGPQSFGALLASKGVSLNHASLKEAMAVLVATGSVAPTLDPTTTDARRPSTESINRAILDGAKRSSSIEYLASPLSGSAVRVNHFSMLFMAARADESKPVDFAMEHLSAMGRRLMSDGVALDAKQTRTRLREQLKGFESETLPSLATLGIA